MRIPCVPGMREAAAWSVLVKLLANGIKKKGGGGGMCIRVCSCAYARVRVCTRVYACVRVCTRVYACVRVCTRVYARLFYSSTNDHETCTRFCEVFFLSCANFKF
jgi:hypothetical protein